MAFSWSKKEEPAGPEQAAVLPETPAAAPGDETPALGQLASHLETIAELSRQVSELGGSLKALAAEMPRQWDVLEGHVRELRERLDGGLQRLAELVTPLPLESQAEPPVSGREWERAILGAALADHPGLAVQRQQLLSGVLEGNAGACALAGQLLVFHSSAAERLPQLLKDVGEAYYRWQPKTKPGNSPMEESLVRWLQQNCETAGLSNVIELVHPGERFDSTRHVASTRGVEITEVLGWIVLRDNGKVYTKASVVVR